MLRAVDAALVLTTRDHTLQLAGCEAVALGKPLVTSDFAYLRALFEYGAVFVKPLPWSIRDGIVELMARREELASETCELRSKRREEWKSQLALLDDLVFASNGSDESKEAGS